MAYTVAGDICIFPAAVSLCTVRAESGIFPETGEEPFGVEREEVVHFLVEGIGAVVVRHSYIRNREVMDINFCGVAVQSPHIRHAEEKRTCRTYGEHSA